MLQQMGSEINKITNQIKSVVSIKRIYLFASFAYGSPSDDSDLDLCIVINREGIRKRDVIKTIRRSISEVATMPVDILVYYENEFEEKAALVSTIEHKIAYEGFSIYEQ
ncbi:MAG: nucleotidyltransferase domain-containing protein [Clostridiales bacterium]|nr:nucleotidyltransferase domain-containing protein [Clostridiales bacterium]